MNRTHVRPQDSAPPYTAVPFISTIPRPDTTGFIYLGKNHVPGSANTAQWIGSATVAAGREVAQVGELPWNPQWEFEPHPNITRRQAHDEVFKAQRQLSTFGHALVPEEVGDLPALLNSWGLPGDYKQGGTVILPDRQDENGQPIFRQRVGITLVEQVPGGQTTEVYLSAHASTNGLDKEVYVAWYPNGHPEHLQAKAFSVTVAGASRQPA